MEKHRIEMQHTALFRSTQESSSAFAVCSSRPGLLQHRFVQYLEIVGGGDMARSSRDVRLGDRDFPIELHPPLREQFRRQSSLL